MPKKQLLDLQFGKFKNELQLAWERNSFYKKKFAEAGIRPDDIRTREDITKVPVTTKEDLIKDIENYPPYGSRLQVQTNEIVLVVETSGTSGRGKEVHPLSSVDLEKVATAECYGFFWAGVRKGTVVTPLLPVTMAAAGVWWLYALSGLQANLFRIGHLDAGEKLNYMKRYGVEVMFAPASYLSRLEYKAQEVGLNIRKELPSLRSILTSSEGRSVDWAVQIEKEWGAKLYEQYGCTQRGIAWTCEYGMLHGDKMGLIHSLPHLCLMEVIDKSSGKPVGTGEEGEIILTPFESRAAPLIRFATNDRAKFMTSEYCLCGRPFDGLQCGSIGRYDDMMKIKGLNVWPDAVDRVVLSWPDVSEYRGELYIDESGSEQAAIHVEFRREIIDVEREAIITQIADKMRTQVGIRFIVKEWTDVTPLFSSQYRGDTGKVRRWTDRRKEASRHQ